MKTISNIPIDSINYTDVVLFNLALASKDGKNYKAIVEYDNRVFSVPISYQVYRRLTKFGYTAREPISFLVENKIAVAVTRHWGDYAENRYFRRHPDYFDVNNFDWKPWNKLFSLKDNEVLCGCMKVFQTQKALNDHLGKRFWDE